MRADHFSPDISEFLALLERRGVRYLIVGGEAVIYYGYARLTGDVDIFFDQTEENSERLFSVLLEFWGGDIPGIDTHEELLEENIVVQFGRPPNRLDLLGSISGVHFEEAWLNRAKVKVESDSPFWIQFIGRSELIRNKRAANRDKDRDDLAYLVGVERTPHDA